MGFIPVKGYLSFTCESHIWCLTTALQHDLARVCDQVGALLTQLATPTAAREGGGATEEEEKDKNRRAKEQIWNKIEVSGRRCVCVCDCVYTPGESHEMMLCTEQNVFTRCQL